MIESERSLSFRVKSLSFEEEEEYVGRVGFLNEGSPIEPISTFMVISLGGNVRSCWSIVGKIVGFEVVGWCFR